MKILYCTSIWVVALLLSACTHNTFLGTREIASLQDKYFLSNEETNKRIKDLKTGPLIDGQCYSDPDTKIYFSNVKESATGNYRELKSQINMTKIENTTDTEYYFCRVTCLLNNHYAAFWTTLTDSPYRHNDDNGFICQNVSMEQVPIPGTSLSTLGPVVKIFSAFAINEILPRIKEMNYKIPAATRAELEKKMAENFVIISKAYISSTLPAMIEAGKILAQIAYQKPGHKAILDKYVLMLKNNSGPLKTEINTDYFILLNLQQHGRYLIYEKM